MLRYINKIGVAMPLNDYKNLCIESVLEYGIKTLSFDMPLTGEYAGIIKEEDFIRTETDEYVVKGIQKNRDTISVTAPINIDELEGGFFESFCTKEQYLYDAITLALAGTGWTCECIISKKRTIRVTNKYVWDIVKQATRTYDAELIIDSLNKRLLFVETVGSDRGSYFTDSLNLKDINIKSDTNDFYTSILAIGKDGLTVASVNGGKKYIENHQYSDKVKIYYWKDERYTVAQSLYDDAVAKLYDLSKPVRSYSCDVMNLAEYSKEYELLDFGIGDIITLVDNATGTRDKQRIKKITHYPQAPLTDTCEISNRVMTFDEIYQKAQETAATVDNITTDDGTVDPNAVKEVDASKITNLDSFISSSATITNLKTTMLTADTADLKYANIDSLNATNAKIGQLETTMLTATVADLKYATVEKLQGVEGKFDKFYTAEFSAVNAVIESMRTNFADINTLMFGNASGGSLITQFANSVVSLLGNAQIKDAMIDTMSVSKVLAGDISTNKFRIVSDSGNILLADNTMLFKDAAGVARVQIGKDAHADYNMYVWDSAGHLMFDALGLTAAGIQRQIIRNDMVSDTANIDAKKIDINSLFNEINGSTNTIKSSKVYLDTDKQTLDVVFKSMITKVNGLSTSVASYGTQINAVQGQINSKVWQQDINTAVSGVSSDVTTISTKYTSLAQNVSGLSATVSSNTSAISKKADGSTVTSLSNSMIASLALKIDKSDNGQIVSMINASANVITLNANRLQWNSTNTSMTPSGYFTCNSGKIAGMTIADKHLHYDGTYVQNGVTKKIGVGICATTDDDTVAIYAGAQSNNISGAPFRVSHFGRMYCQNGANIGGFSFDACRMVGSSCGLVNYYTKNDIWSIYAGADQSRIATAPFRVRFDGVCYAKEIHADSVYGNVNQAAGYGLWTGNNKIQISWGWDSDANNGYLNFLVDGTSVATIHMGQYM